MNTQSLAILDTIINDSICGLFAVSGIKLAPIASLPESHDHTFAASIGFTNPQMPGTLVLTLDRELAVNSRPTELRAKEPSEQDLDDWVGELVNQLIGRIKNQLLRHKLELELSIPAVVRGRWLRRGLPEASISRAMSFMHDQGTVHVCLDAIAAAGLELNAINESSEVYSEGEVALF
jgi:hypothetical protein